MAQTWEALLTALGVKGAPPRLTEDIVKRTRVRPLGFRYRLKDGTVPGLGLRVGAAGGAGTWVLAYRAGGRLEALTLAREDRLSLKGARARARTVLGGLREGVNPAAARRDTRKAEEREAARLTLRAFIEGDYWRRKLVTMKTGRPTQLRIMDCFPDLLDKPLDMITSEDIETTLAKRRADGFAAGTVRRDWSDLRAALGCAVEWQKLDKIPVYKLPSPLRRWEPTKRIRYFERGPDERERFLAVLALREARMAEGDDVARLLVFGVRLAWATGMRRGEILGLRDAEVGETAITLPPHRTKNGKGRVIRLNADAREALKLWKLRGPSGVWFPGYLGDGGKLGPNYSIWRFKLWRAFRSLCREAKVEDFHLHDLRHVFATDIRRQGTPLDVTGKALGHTDLRSTQIYAHVGADEVAAAVEKVRIS